MSRVSAPPTTSPNGTASPMQPLVVTPPVTDPAQIRSVRSTVASCLGRADASRRDAVLLVVSELVTNAVLHAGGSSCVRVLDAGDRIRIEVDDVAPDDSPAQRTTGPHDVTGRGLQIVDQLAERWGVVQRDRRKTVWCELGIDPGPGAT